MKIAHCLKTEREGQVIQKRGDQVGIMQKKGDQAVARDRMRDIFQAVQVTEEEAI